MQLKTDPVADKWKQKVVYELDFHEYIKQLWDGTEEYVYYEYLDDGTYVKIDKDDYNRYQFPIIVFVKKK